MAVKGAGVGRRQHTHLLLPHAALDGPQRALFETALRPTGWVADPDDSSSMSVRWNRGRAALRLQTLGWFPLLVTVGPIGKATAAHRDAVARLTAAVLASRGMSFSDQQLVEYLPQAQARWQRALLERRRLSTAERMLQARRCSYCASWSDTSATHCAGCRRRFTVADDTEWDATVSRASATVAEAEAVLADLARGVVLERLNGASHG
ncbi:hypothetical protein OG474_22580 [Kribbella sp. NBC_01505]|uniref:hypothetical protein n=1 Tax=Kribbella sp. NBC_01505 TaxID=2903580 RepID=UPI00386765AA